MMDESQQLAAFDAFERRFEDLRAAIDDALRIAESGKIPGMIHLMSEVEQICIDVEAAPAPVKHQVQPIMGEVIGLLDTLEFKLRDIRGA